MSLSSEPDPPLLDGLPQGPRLAQFAAELWANPSVAAIWLGGSLARGEADAYSDVDLRVALQPEAYDEDRLPDSAKGLLSAATTCLKFQFGLDTVLWHMLLDDGTIYDLHVQSTETDPPAESRLVLACREPDFGEKLAQNDETQDHRFPPACPDDMVRVLQFFWMNQQKHLKALHRGLPLLTWQGEFLMRQDLLRLQYVLLTGKDPGPVSRMTIHTLTPVIHTIQQETGDRMLRVIGRPMRTPDELMDAIAHLRDEVARVGRLLAQKLGFDYPVAAEETVRRSWEHFDERPDHAI